MLNENIMIISGIAKDFINNGDIHDIDKNKSEILFPFFEEVLGYDTLAVGDIVVAPAYTSDGTYKLDYGLRSNRPGYYKSCFKIINRGSKFEDEYLNIKKCLTMVESEFIIVTDCFEYNFLVYEESKDDLISIGNYSILKPEECDQSLLDLIRCPNEKTPKQEFAVRDDEDTYEDDSEVDLGLDKFKEEDDIPIVPKKKKVTKKKKANNNKIFVIAAIIVGILLTILLIGFFTRDENGRFFSNLYIVGNQIGIKKGQLDGTLNLVVDENAVVSMSLYSRNIPRGGVIKFEIVAGTYKDAVYGSIGADGKAYATFTIPEFWDEQKINIIAYLRFDESNYAQPSNVKAEFGEIGEEIIGKEDAPDKFAITFGSIIHDSQAIRDKLAADALEAERIEKEKRLALLNKLNIRMDSLGNWKILPLDYNMNEVNITESINIYPQIFYNGEENLPYFYLVCGNINQMQILRFTHVVFYADGYQWSYEVSSNTKEISVDGGIAKEWVYFHNINTPKIINDAKLLAQSELSKITFRGDKIKEHVLTKNEKDTIITMITAYEKYFNTGSAPKQEWYVEYMESKNPTVENNKPISSGNISLSYIKKPDIVLERESDAEKELNDLLLDIQEKRLKGEAVAAHEEAQLELYMDRYKILSEDLINKLYSEITSASGILTIAPEFDELKSGYYKLYFEYDKSAIKIENGYITELYILPDQTVYVPIKTVVGKNEKGYATFKLSNTTYKEFLKFISSAEYEIVE